jgi:hypothetical protein
VNITNNEDNQQEGELAMRVITVEATVTRSRPAGEATIRSKAVKIETKFTTGNIHASENTNNMITTMNKAEETSTAKNRITSKTNNSTRTTSRWEPTWDYHEDYTKTRVYEEQGKDTAIKKNTRATQKDDEHKHANQHHKMSKAGTTRATISNGNERSNTRNEQQTWINAAANTNRDNMIVRKKITNRET